MHGLILLTAMSATGGLFGGNHARPARGHNVQSVYASGGCATSVRYAAAPVSYAPAPAAYVQTAPQTSYPAPAATVSYQSFYSVGSTCASGSCQRR